RQRTNGLARSLITRAIEQVIELHSVRLSHPQQVTGAARLDRALRKGAPQLRDVTLNHLGRRGRRMLLPEQVDQAFARDSLPGVEQQERKQRTLPSRGERELAAVRPRLERTQNPELHPADASARRLPTQAGLLPLVYRR